MKDTLQKILEEARQSLQAVSDEKTLEELRVKYLGKKGVIKEFLGQLGSLEIEMRKELGRIANEVKDEVERLLEEAENRLKSLKREMRLKEGVVDVSLPVKSFPVGYPHPLTLVTQKMVSIFQSMGYTVVDGPELEKEEYNFDMLNIPKHHPARDDHDSFYVIEGWLMRTHTSPVQIRTMLAKKPPIAVIVPGRCYRRDAVDATHSHTFHQMEGLV
ncbi:MAG: phenylalanine--tRNA ligase subunit alpha, partial [Brevinematales bacterium]